jgi:CRP-like cAMP-binding protein
MQTQHVQAGATIFSAGDHSEGVYIIEDGEVAVTVASGVEVARLQSGELLGESGVLERRVRSATATAVSPATLLVIPAETFMHAFGMGNDKALALVTLLCRRLRTTTHRVARLSPSEPVHGVIRMAPDSDRLVSEYGMETVELTHLPFQVGNRYGGEILPITSNHSYCIAARGETNLAAPHFEILRRDGQIGVRDLATPSGTIINGFVSARGSLQGFVPLHSGDNEVIAGRPGSPFRFRMHLDIHPRGGTGPHYQGTL